MKQLILDRMEVNLARAETLVMIYKTHLKGTGRGRRGHAKTDVLRAAVVFIHASVEEVLRSTAYWKLPLAGSTYLDNLFLPGEGKKVALGALAAHRGKTVDQVIAESVNDELEKSNYNNPKEIAALCMNVGVLPTDVNHHFAVIDLMMKRRHKIVHRADRSEIVGRGQYQFAHISPEQVESWIEAAKNFCVDFVGRVPE
ncbi:hypothetical protein SAMN05216588_12613 [Pseudomonas flavescens]|uniref:RiboL-PSP-HEPN domain-containing protein n=1 Tax=Phytopseudomonas flavescens TaxID=29435 RepID=A0A1G8NUN7_9GAMM|nr:hypothetical protein [Pseudomonas flavescens]SDI83666.1 hypothetical protein SAMN05216588_12613 [Pseudomonas flavescens]